MHVPTIVPPHTVKASDRIVKISLVVYFYVVFIDCIVCVEL